MGALRSGKRIILPVFITHQGCPHRCIFCNQRMATDHPDGMPPPAWIQDRIDAFVRTTKGRVGSREVAFYGGTFTALSWKDQKSLLQNVLPFLQQGAIDAIRVSTRPDAIDPDRLDLLQSSGVRTVELGAQSMVDEILEICQRGHTSRDVVESFQRVRSMGFETGLQVMLGLPGEDRGLFLATIRRIVDLAPDFVRIYPLVVMRGSALERQYLEGSFSPISLTEAIQWAKEALKLFEPVRIPVIRMGLQANQAFNAPGAILAGPFHPAFRSLVESAIFYDMACSLLGNRGNGSAVPPRFRVAPGDLSSLLGERRKNVERLRQNYGLGSIEIFQDPDIARGVLCLEIPGGNRSISRGCLMGLGTPTKERIEEG